MSKASTSSLAAAAVRPSTLWILTLLSSGLLPLALPNALFPWGQPVLGFFALAPLFAALTLAPSFGRAALLGVVFGGISTLLANYWLRFFQGYTVWTIGGVVVAYVGFNALLAPFLRGLARAAPRARPLVLASAWALYEYLKSVGFLGYPWGLIAYPVQGLTPLIQLVDITGIWGLSFLMALFNAAAAEGLLAFLGPSHALGRRLVVRPAAFAAAALALGAAALLYGGVRLALPPPPGRSLDLLLVQANRDPWERASANAETVREFERLSEEGIREGGRPDLIVWSETSFPYPLVSLDPRFEVGRSKPLRELASFVQRTGAPLLTGTYVWVDFERQEAMNGAALLSSEGRVLDWYGKQHPVPFAEAIPFWEVPLVRRVFQDLIGLYLPWVMGSRTTIFEVAVQGGATVRFGAPICFEDAFSDLGRQFILRGADLWINLTNDAWSQRVYAETQHFVAAKFRAVENRRPLVRSTLGGVTAVVDPLGRTLASLPLFEAASLRVRVPLPLEEELTPYTRFGDYFPRLLGVGLFGLLLFRRLRPVRPS